MNKYNNLAKRLELEMLNQYENTMHYINSNETTLKSYLTPARLKLYEAGEMPREKALKCASDKLLKTLQKRTNEQLTRLEVISDVTETIDTIEIAVEWTRSATWGSNPKASIDVYSVERLYKRNHYESGSIGGCGYDKESTAVANALNQSPLVQKFLCDIAENAEYKNGYRESIGYGSGYSIIPYFEGGVGVNCFWSIFRKFGYVCQRTATGKSFDVYSITKIK